MKMLIESERDLLSMKELAARLKRSESYVKQMKRRGFRTVAGRVTLREALQWLARNPQPFAPVEFQLGTASIKFASSGPAVPTTGPGA